MPAFEDQHLRPVRMTSGRALGYVQAETASQILCQLLDKKAWERLLDGRIGRKPLSAPYAGCQIATEQGMVSMRFLARDDAFAADTRMVGRPSTLVQKATGNAIFTVALTDDALQPAPRQSYPVRRLLELEMVGGDYDEQRDVGTRVLTEIVPLLVKDGEPLPDIDAQGHVRYVTTPVDADQFVDLPTPVQALALCTVLQGEGATKIDVFDTGRCSASIRQERVVVEAHHTRHPAEYPERIAGRPARLVFAPPMVEVLLRDGAEVELTVDAPDPVALAEKIVPLLVG